MSQSNFKVRLRKPTATSTANQAFASTKTIDSKSTNDIGAKVAKLTNNVDANVEGFKRPSNVNNTGNIDNVSSSKTTSTEQYRSRKSYIDNMLRTPPIPSALQRTASTKPITTIEEVTTTGGTKTTRIITDELNGPGGGVGTSNLTSSTYTNTQTYATMNSISSFTQDIFESQRRQKVIESNPGLFEKFRNLKLSTFEEEEDNDENELPKLPTSIFPSKKSSPEKSKSFSKTPTRDFESPEYVPPKRSLRKVVRAFSADQSVVEVLQENESYSAQIAASIASQAPSGTSKKGSSQKRRAGSSRKGLVSSSKKTLKGSKEKASLRKYPSKELSGSSKGRVLKPINLDSYMAAADPGESSSKSSVDPLLCSSSTSSPPPLKPSKSCSSLNPAVVKPHLDTDITSVEDTFVRLKAANSMPQLAEKCSISSPPSKVAQSKTTEPKASHDSAFQSASKSNSRPLKSLKLLGKSVASVPNVRDLVGSSSVSKHKPSGLSAGQIPPFRIQNSSSKSGSKEATQQAKSQSQSQQTPTNAAASSSSNRTIQVKEKCYQLLNRIGRGGSSVVYQVFDPISRRILALKLVDLSRADSSVVIGFRNEIKLLNSLRDCKRVVRMFDFEFRKNNKELLIIMEKGDDDLANVLKAYAETEGSKLSPHMIRYYWQEMVKVVNEIHQRNIVHSDLKPVNFILVSGKLKLIDFGIANAIQSNKTSVYKDCIIGTVDFMAPESFQKKAQLDGKSVVKFNQKADIWSLGVILYNLVYGHTPYSQFKDNMRKGMAIINDPIDYPSIDDTLLLDVIQQCLQKDSTKRPTAAELLNHRYLTNQLTGSETPKPKASSSTESLNQIVSPSKSSSIPSDLLSQVSAMTPTTLKNFSKLIQSMSKK